MTRRKHQPLSLGLLLATVLAGACQPAGELGGSMGGTFSLQFDRVLAYRLGSELVVVFEAKRDLKNPVRPYGFEVTNQIARLTFHTDRQAIEVGTELAFGGGDASPALSVERYVLGEDGEGRFQQEAQLPKLLRATARFDKLPEGTTGTVKGKFDAVFVNQDVLWGDFEAELSAP